MVFVCNVVCDRQLLLAAQRGCSQNSRYRKHIYAYISENVHVYSKHPLINSEQTIDFSLSMN